MKIYLIFLNYHTPQMFVTYWKTINADRFKVHNIINIAGKHFYVDDDTKPPKVRAACERFMIKLVQNTTIIVIMILISYGVAALSGLYAIIFVDRHNTFVGTEIPFVYDAVGYDVGYWINIVEQVFASGLSLTSNLAIEIAVCLVYNAFALMPELIYIESQELNAELNLNGMSLIAASKYRNIVMQVQDYSR